MAAELSSLLARRLGMRHAMVGGDVVLGEAWLRGSGKMARAHIFFIDGSVVAKSSVCWRSWRPLL